MLPLLGAAYLIATVPFNRCLLPLKTLLWGVRRYDLRRIRAKPVSDKMTNMLAELGASPSRNHFHRNGGNYLECYILIGLRLTAVSPCGSLFKVRLSLKFAVKYTSPMTSNPL